MSDTLFTASKEAIQSFNQFVNTIIMLKEHVTPSLPRFTKPYMVEAPLFIQQKIFSETDLLNDVISSIYDLYAGYVLLAVKLDSVVEGGTRVRDVLSTVSTSSMVTTTRAASEQYIEANDIINNFGEWESFNVSLENEREVKPIITDESRRILSGRLLSIPVTIQQGDSGKTRIVNVPLYIKLNPRIFPNSIVDDIVSANINTSIKQRWLQYKAGEISFFKDFLMQLDLAHKRSKALKKDKSGILFDILYNRHKGLLRRILKLSGINSRTMNLFNSIFIFDRFDLKRASNNAGINFDRYSDRQKFFNRNYAMIVASIDNQYSILDLYVDSIKQKGEYTFNQMKKLSKKGDTDIIEIIKALQQQQVSMRVI